MSKTEKIGRIDCSVEPSRTQQSAKDECDINIIVERAKRGADISHLSKAAPMYGDFTKIPSYREALQIVVDARTAFNALDANVRERFANDPAKMIDFLRDGKNYDEALKLGLVKPRPVAVETPSVPEKAPKKGSKDVEA